jgi:hypothetical protein
VLLFAVVAGSIDTVFPPAAVDVIPIAALAPETDS